MFSSSGMTGCIICSTTASQMHAIHLSGTRLMSCMGIILVQHVCSNSQCILPTNVLLSLWMLAEVMHVYRCDKIWEGTAASCHICASSQVSATVSHMPSGMESTINEASGVFVSILIESGENGTVSNYISQGASLSTADWTASTCGLHLILQSYSKFHGL